MKRRNAARWRALTARLGRELTIWVSTVRFDGRPHLTPTWFIWLDERLYIAISEDSQKFANLRHNQQITAALPDTDWVTIIEGEAHVADRETVAALGDYFYHKYEWDFRYDDTAVMRLIEITPYKILAWGDDFDAEGIRLL